MLDRNKNQLSDPPLEIIIPAVNFQILELRRQSQLSGRTTLHWLQEMSYNPRKRQRVSPDPKDYPFVFFGAPLPPLDPEIRDDGTFVPLWKQEVPDARLNNS